VSESWEVRMSYSVAFIISSLKLSLCLTKHHAMEMFWGSRGTALCFLWPWH